LKVTLEKECKLAVQQNGFALQYIENQTEELCKLALCVTLKGAVISTSSGIPDFLSAGWLYDPYTHTTILDKVFDSSPMR
jgi:NAD-dependent SIR2 family protein deacetylase